MKDADHYGYYLFLGVGGYEAASSIGSSWTSRWDLPEWRRRIDSLVRLGTDTLFIFLTGDDLPFLSEHYPECAESGHPNVADDFFQQVLDHALEKNVEVAAVFSTTGHARGFARTRPELSTHNRQGRLQVGSGVLCHKAGCPPLPAQAHRGVSHPVPRLQRGRPPPSGVHRPMLLWYLPGQVPGRGRR